MAERQAAVLPLGSRAQLATTLAEGVDNVAGVRRFPGFGTEVSTQHRGGRVLGIGLAEREVAVHVAVERLPLQPVLKNVHKAIKRVLEQAGDARSAHVYVDLLDLGSLPRRLR